MWGRRCIREICLEEIEIQTMMNEINYTIIIPHKNIPDLLRRCLNSIPRRDDIQIIVVDDNSDPEKVDFEHFPGVGEKCVEVYFTKEGKGAGYARNVGLKHAKGKWLLFADADDFFEEDFIVSLDKYLTSAFDVIYFNSRELDADTLIKISCNRYIERYISHQISLKMLAFYSVVPWGKMIKRSFIDKNCISFEEVKAGNDVLFSYKLACRSHNMEISSDIIYNYLFKRKGALTSSHSEDIFVIRFKVQVNGNIFLRENGFSFYACSPILMIFAAAQYSLKRVCWCIFYSIKNRVVFCGLRRITSEYMRKLHLLSYKDDY